MAFHAYGNSERIRQELNQFMSEDHPNYQGELVLPEGLIFAGREYATDLINAKLTPRYPEIVPWASGDVPRFIDTLANCLAKGWITEQKNPGPAPNDDRKFVSAKNKCETYLEEMASGDIELPGVDTPGPTIGFTHSGKTPAADVDPIENQNPDQDLLDDIADRRD